MGDGNRSGLHCPADSIHPVNLYRVLMTSTTHRLKFAGFLLLIALTVTLVYTTLHEGGHALAGLAFGGRITEFTVNFFNLLGAHVNIDGDFSRSQNAVINVSGAGLPLLSWLVLVLALPKKGSPLVQWTKFFATVGTLFTLLAWVIIPFLYLRNSAPAGDDVTKFIANSGLPPLAVAFSSLALFVGGWLLFALRFGRMRTSMRLLFTGDGKPVTPWRWALTGVLVVAALAAAGMLVTSTLGNDSPQPPQGFDLAATVDLSGRDVQAETIAWFNLAEAGDAAIFLRISSIDTLYIDVTLVPPQGDPLLLLHGEDFSSEASVSQYQYSLPAGEYKIVLTSQKSPGILKVYFRLP
jgi:hypothetical protein